MPLLRRTHLSMSSLSHSARLAYSTQNVPVTIGIRREDPARVWERRAPLTPDTVADLISHDGVRVLVQDCERRVFPTDEYIRVRLFELPIVPAYIIHRLARRYILRSSLRTSS